MTFAEGVLRLVRSGARVDSVEDRAPSARADYRADQHEEPAAPAVAVESATQVEPTTDAFSVALFAQDDLAPDQTAALSHLEPGFSDIEAGVALVEAANVLILPTVTRPGGRVDIVIARDSRTDG